MGSMFETDEERENREWLESRIHWSNHGGHHTMQDRYSSNRSSWDNDEDDDQYSGGGHNSWRNDDGDWGHSNWSNNNSYGGGG